MDIHQRGATKYIGQKKSLRKPLNGSGIRILLMAPPGWGFSNLPCKNLCSPCGQSACSRSRVHVLVTASSGGHGCYLSPSSPVPSAQRHPGLLWDQMSFGLSDLSLTCCGLSLLSCHRSCACSRKSLATTLAPPSPQIFPWEHRQRLLFLEKPYVHIYMCVSVCACVRSIKNSKAVKFSCSF